MTRAATSVNAFMIKRATNKGCGGVAQGAILSGIYVVRVFTDCRYAIMAGGAVINDAGVIEYRANKAAGIMTNTAILIGRNMRGWFTYGKHAIMTRLAVIHDTDVIKGCR